MIKITVIEDDANDKEKLLGIAKRIFDENRIETEFQCFSSVEEYLASENQEQDLCFFDISLPGMNGMDLAKKIRENGSEDTIIIFVTSLANYAIEGYSVNASAYILKPITYEDMNLKLKRIIQTLNAKASKDICLDTTEGLVTVKMNDILYIEIIGHYLNYHFKDNTVAVRDTIRNAQAQLKDHGFVMINQCYLVNLKHITRTDDDFAYIADKPLKISRSKKKGLREALLKTYAA